MEWRSLQLWPAGVPWPELTLTSSPDPINKINTKNNNKSMTTVKQTFSRLQPDYGTLAYE